MPFQFGCLLVSTQKLLLQTFLPFQRQERSRADLPHCRGRDSLGDLGNLFLIQHKNPPSPAKFAQECYRQRFLGSLPRAAHLHHWLLGDAEICPSAAATRMVGVRYPPRMRQQKRSIGSDLFPIVLRFHLCLNELGICQNLTVFTPKQLAESWLFIPLLGKPYVA